MKKRMIAILLIIALLLVSGCASGNTEDFGAVGVGGQNGSGEQNAGDGADGNGSIGAQNGGTQNGATQNGGAQNGGAQNGGAQNGESSSQNGGSASLGQTFGAGQPVEMKKGETIWFGPCSAEQAGQFTFTSGETASGGGAVKCADFGGGFSIWSFKAPANGKATPAVGDKYKDVFLMTKTEMTLAGYFGFWDNQKNRNLYDLRFDKSGKWIDVAGKLQTAKSGEATHAIPVAKGETLTFGPVRAGQPVLGYAYDAAGKPVAMLNGYELKTNFTFTQGMVSYTYTVPQGVAAVRFNVNEDESDLFLVMKNLEYTADQYQRMTKKKVGDAADPLAGKKCLFIGDSICAAGADTGTTPKGWAGRVQEGTGAECINEGVSGAALSNCRVGRPGALPTHIIYKQLEVHKKTKFDYVLIHGGVNDAWDTKSIGFVSRGYDPAGFDLTTYAGGLEMTIYTAIENYGDTAAIGYLMNFQIPRCSYGVAATKLGEYFEVGKQICEKWGISYFDMYNHKEITSRMDVNGSKCLPDGVHPNTAGYDVLGPYIIKYMRSMTPTTQAVLDELANQ